MSYQPPYGNQGGYGGGFPPPAGPPTGKTKVLGLDHNIAAMLCYILVCICCLNLVPAILWLATEPKDSRFLRFHSLQALLLMVVLVAVSILFWILGVGAAMTPSDVTRVGGGGLVSIIQLLVNLVFLVIFILGAVKAYQGQMWKLPVIGDIAEKNA